MDNPRFKANPDPPIDLSFREDIRFLHPGYEPPYDTLLYLPRVDVDDTHVSTFGVHHRTALVACQIIANNAFDRGYFALDRAGEYPVDTPADGILTRRAYYFLVDGVLVPYPVVPSFQDWEFPHDRIPDSWPQTIATPAIPDRCGVTNSSYAIEETHLVPKTETLWYHRNQMGRYGEGLRDINDAVNLTGLRSDIHTAFDDRQFVIVPKVDEVGSPSTLSRPQYVTHVLLKKAAELWPTHHDILVQYLPRNSRPYLFGRFAWAVLLLVKPFLLQGVSRHVIRIGASKEDRLERKAGVLTGLQLLNFYGAGGSKAASPMKKRSRGDGSVVDVVESCGDDDDDNVESCGSGQDINMNNAYDFCGVENGSLKGRRDQQGSSETAVDDDDDQEQALADLKTSLQETLSEEGYIGIGTL